MNALSKLVHWFARLVGAGLLWFNLLRVPLIIALLVAALPMFVLLKFGPVALIRGAYETGPREFGAITLILGFLLLSFCENTRIVLEHGVYRFGISRKFAPAPRLVRTAVYLIYFLGPILTIVLCLKLRREMPAVIQWLPDGPREAPGSWSAYAFWGIAGLLPAMLAQLFFDRAFRTQVLADPNRLWHRILGRLGPGYLNEKGGPRAHVARGHRRAVLFCLLSFIAYGIIGKYCHPQRLPAALYVLLTLLPLSWLFSGLSFYLDRYRASLILMVAVWLFIGPNRWRADYTYQTIPVGTMQTDSDLPRAGLVLGDLNPQAQPDNQLPKYRGIKPGTVCVSAVGGGIHSGAWEVEVLTRLAEIPGCENLPNQIRVISGTSGGSYGAMFYTHAMYPPPGTRHPPSGETLRSVVQSTSLSSVVAAFAYHDLLGYCLPVLSGKDRGQAMEDQWVENGQALGDNELEHVTLWDWSQRLGRGEMPAVLFTSGTRESGRPIIFGTSRVKDWNFNVRQTHLPEDGAFPLLTTRVTTGARLSATFPWVSPAARPDPANQTRRAEHQLDGGYYDNYGIVALNAWLDEGLMEVFGPRSLNWGQRLQLMTEQQGEKKTRPPARTKGSILVIQIRYEQKPKEPTTEGPGFFFQLTAPIFGLYNARTAGQQLRTDDYFDVFSRYWKERGIEVENAAFDFKDEAPLSWHLTQQERDELRKQGESIASELIAYPTEMKKAQDIPDEKARHAALAEVNRKYSRGIAADRVRNFLRMKLE